MGNHRRLARADGSFAFVMALASVVYGNSARIPVGELHRFLEMRITVLNAAFAGLFILMWAYCFESLGLYWSEHRGILSESVRITAGCAFMTAALGFYLITARTTGPTARISRYLCRLARFWQPLDRRPRSSTGYDSGQRKARRKSIAGDPHPPPRNGKSRGLRRRSPHLRDGARGWRFLSRYDRRFKRPAAPECG